MKRRTFIAALGGAAVWPLVARAQQQRLVGIVLPGRENDPGEQNNLAAFQDGLQRLGWSHGRNVRFEVRWQAASAERASMVVSELLNLHCDVIVVGTIQAFLSLRRVSSPVPIVFVNLPDPVATGLADNLAKTGSNFTGFTAYEYSIAGKWLEVLKDLAPRVTRVGMLFGTATAPVGENFYRSLEANGPSFGVKTTAIRFANSETLESAIDAFAVEPNGGLIMAAEAWAFTNRATIIRQASRYGLPTVYPFRNIPAEGGLAFYGIDFIDLWARAPSYVDRILRGANPADLPIQAPTKFELVINLRTAKQLGLEVPAALSARADEVIE